MKAAIHVKVSVSRWFRWVYWPLVRCGLWIGFPVSVETVEKAVKRATRVEVV